MYVKNGVAYSEETLLKVCGVRVLDNYKLWLRFNTGEIKIFDFTPLLSKPAFASLKDEKNFKNVYIDYGVLVWNDGDIDIAPEALYEDSVSIGDLNNA